MSARTLARTWLARVRQVREDEPQVRPRRDGWILWAALGCALVSTAHAEYTLALSVGASEYVAWAVPGALDLYVLGALRRNREVLAAVLVMVAANVSSYLVHSGDLPVGWPLRSAVGALAPLILWRLHSLWRKPGTPRVHAPEPVPVPIPPQVPAQVQDEYLHHTVEVQPGPNGELPPDLVPDGIFALFRDVASAVPVDEPVPDHVPDSWVQHEDLPESPDEYEPEVPEGEPRVLEDGDVEYLDVLDAYLTECKAAGTDPAIRGLKKYAGVGQTRAVRLLKYKGVLPK